MIKKTSTDTGEKKVPLREIYLCLEVVSSRSGACKVRMGSVQQHG
jgi:hypothetical protein